MERDWRQAPKLSRIVVQPGAPFQDREQNTGFVWRVRGDISDVTYVGPTPMMGTAQTDDLIPDLANDLGFCFAFRAGALIGGDVVWRAEFSKTWRFLFAEDGGYPLVADKVLGLSPQPFSDKDRLGLATALHNILQRVETSEEGSSSKGRIYR